MWLCNWGDHIPHRFTYSWNCLGTHSYFTSSLSIPDDTMLGTHHMPALLVPILMLCYMPCKVLFFIIIWIHCLRTLQSLGLIANDEKKHKRKWGNPVATATSSNQSGAAGGHSSQTYNFQTMSVTSPTPPAGIHPVPLVTIYSHFVTWMSTTWPCWPTHKVGHHHPLVIGLVAMHIAYQQSRN